MKDQIPEKMMRTLIVLFLALTSLITNEVDAQRVTVLPQITHPHNYYFRGLYLPQLTSGPSSVAWSPDGESLVFSMGGSLWKQSLNSETAEQLTDSTGYDYQPDWSPDGSRIVFTRYNGSSVELMLLDVNTRQAVAITNSQAVNLEPRWSPDGHDIAYVSTATTGHFLIYKASIAGNKLANVVCLTPDRKSSVKRYYYGEFDHAIHPAWSKDGKKIYYISNREIAHGSGDILSISTNGGEPTLIQHEETSWQTRPDISPDGTRMVYSSYLGRAWHQLWLLPVKGGYPFALTYGDYDNTSARWSPDGKKIAFISNRDGNTSLWYINSFDGRQQQVVTKDLRFLQPQTQLTVRALSEDGKDIAARISVTDSRGKFYAPREAWIQADDSKSPGQVFESHYFHGEGPQQLSVPKDKVTIQVFHGPEYEIAKLEVDTHKERSAPVVVQLSKLRTPAGFGTFWSGDVHVHMNYGGHYRNNPANLVKQAAAENLNFVYNLVVNKEQRIFDIPYFSTSPDKNSNERVQLLHGQEFHTSYWGHLGLLNLKDHFIVPDYAGYPYTAAESLFPNNRFIADVAHEQQGLVGYVHPFDPSDFYPDQSATLTSELPVDAALKKVDYYEVIGFAEHKASEGVWYKLLNCGFRIAAAGGTDAMANYASLRGPLGLNRVYVSGSGPLDHELFEKNLKSGKSFVSNGPILGFKVESAMPGDSITITAKGQRVAYSGFVRSAVPVEFIEVVWNGDVVAKHPITGSAKSADLNGTLNVKGPGWLLLRAWSSNAHPDLPDLYPYASTNPVYVQTPEARVKSKSSGEFFIKWLKRLEDVTKANTNFRTEGEREQVLEDIKKARTVYEDCINTATIR